MSNVSITRSSPGRLLVAFVLATSTMACSTWRPRGGSVPEAVQAVDRDRPARLTLRDGRELTLDSLAVRGDSVVGYTRARPPARIAVPLGAIARVAERRVDAEETAANALVGAFGVVVALMGLFLLVARGSK